MADGVSAADVEYFAIARVIGAGTQEGVRRVVDENEVAELRAVAVNLNGAVF